jgi:molybdenum cofactor cytidylyltransferase
VADNINAQEGEHAIVILAAGASRRLGRPKQLVEIGGQPLVRRAAEAALATGSRSVHVVVGAEASRVRGALEGLPVGVILNEEWEEGIASSIRRAVDAIDRHASFIETMTLMLCDQPGVSTVVLVRLVDTWRATRAAVVASRYPEGPGVPALFQAELFSALKELRGDLGARQLIRQLDRDVVTVELESPEDIDTPDDLQRLHD